MTVARIDLHPFPVRDRPTLRLTLLTAGLLLYGASMAMQIRAGLGLNPWDVLHEGLTLRTPLSFGLVTAVTGALVLLAWIPLRQRPGIGTVANIVLIAVAVDATLAVLPPVDGLGPQIALLVGGVVVNGFAGAVYVGTRLGPGPRDGLMTGLHRRTGYSVRSIRTVLELTVLALGWLLGGTVGVGTVLYALAIGPIIQFFLRWTVVRPTDPGPVAA